MTLSKQSASSTGRQVATHPSNISMRSELLRKGIHLTSMLIPAIYIFVSKLLALEILIPLTAFAVTVELLRTRVPSVERFIVTSFGDLLRTHERLESRDGPWKLSGATWVFLSATICVAAFPKVVAVTAFAVLILSDTVAALIGRRFGRRRFLAKSVAGSSAFFIAALLIVFCVAGIYRDVLAGSYWVFILAGVVSSAVATVAEAASYGINIDDNLSIPLSFSLVMWPILLLANQPAIDAVLKVGALH